MMHASTQRCGHSFPGAYNLKSIADYGTGPGSHVSGESARDAVQIARRFVESVMLLMLPNGHVVTRAEALIACEAETRHLFRTAKLCVARPIIPRSS